MYNYVLTYIFHARARADRSIHSAWSKAKCSSLTMSSTIHRTMAQSERHQLDRDAGLLSFDAFFYRRPSYQPTRLSVLWIENDLDCRMWAYYCDIRKAMAKFHDLCTPRGAQTCMDGRNGITPDVAIVGPRFSINIGSEDETVGFDRNRFPSLPLLVIQNKMYTPKGWKEIVGNRTAKLAWVREAGASAAFTWLTKHREFSRKSRVPHHWMPFGVDAELFGAAAGTFGKRAQPYDVGFTGASGKDKYPERAALIDALRSMNISSYFGEWSQTLLNRADPRSWKAGSTFEYAAQLAQARIWLSTLGPSNIVGTRYFEVIASGTTLLMCSAPPRGEWIYDGLFEDGVHVVMFDGVDDMKAKVQHYLDNEQDRQEIVRNARDLVQKIHTWDARALFMTAVAEVAIQQIRASPGSAPRYLPPPGALSANHSSYLGCFASAGYGEEGLSEPPRTRNKRRLYRYTVASCLHACRSRHRRGMNAALTGGGFATGNGHTQARCMCAMAKAQGEDRQTGTGTKPEADKEERRHSRLQLAGWKRRPEVDCATTCSLKDSRPCGGSRAYAFFNLEGGVQ